MKRHDSKGPPGFPSPRSRTSASTRSWEETLVLLSKRRAIYHSCLQGIAEGAVEDFLPSGAPILELGAGLGQLGDWLGKGAVAAWTLTDPDETLVSRLAERFPEGAVRVMDAQSTGLPDASQTGIAGLCLLDVVPNLHACAQEIARILKPGGTFLHLLDMTTSLPLPLVDVAEGGFVAIPNVLFDPSEATWPEDLLLLERAPLKRLLRELKAVAHPLPHVFGEYFQLFRKAPFPSGVAASALRDLLNDDEGRTLLAEACKDADRLALARGWPRLRATPVSSTRHLETRMQDAFRGAGLQVLVSDLALTWDTVRNEEPGAWTYRSLCVGHERVLTEGQPPKLLNQGAPQPGAGTGLIETGVFVFAARKPL